MTRAAWQRRRPIDARWIRRLRAIPQLERTRDLGLRRELIEDDFARLSRLYAAPLDACAVVRRWRRAGWADPPPAQIARVVRLSQPRERPKRLLADLGPPGHNGYCDPVFSELSPDDAFCG